MNFLDYPLSNKFRSQIPKEEAWLDIIGYEGRYQVSNRGNIKSIRGKARKERTLKPFPQHDGYLLVQLRGKTYTVHRLVAKMFLPNATNKSEVNHKNAIKTDNSVDNLEWVTGAENMAHAVRNKLMTGPLGQYARTAKLTNCQVLRMRLLKEITPGLSLKSMGTMFGISVCQAGKIIRRNCWAHI